MSASNRDGAVCVASMAASLASMARRVASMAASYDRSAAAHVIERIAVPTLILNAANDPFIRILAETRRKILDNPHITFVETEDGGHCSYLAKPNESNDGRWAESQIVEFLRTM